MTNEYLFDAEREREREREPVSFLFLRQNFRDYPLSYNMKPFFTTLEILLRY